MGGMMGDAIQSLYAVKNICELCGEKANVYISGHGDVWTRGIEVAYQDLKQLMACQEYIDNFEMYDANNHPKNAINLSDWREVVAKTHSETGKYDKCWTELLSQVYKFPIPKEYKWLNAIPDNRTKDCFVIHRSKHRHNPNFDWEGVINKISLPIYFVTTDYNEWELFPYKYSGINLYLVDNIYQLASAIAGCKGFLGNQSAPFSIACALDVPRFCELDFDPAAFYMDERKYSPNIGWFLSDECKHIGN